MIVADTDVLIDCLSGRGEANRIAVLIESGALRTTAISRFELLSGAREPSHVARILKFLAPIPCLALDQHSADMASEVRRTLDGSGSTIGMADSLIAGIVLCNGGILLTRNRRHFERVQGITLV
jgi:tRNA(fMet)-specific endonuclease VapC